MVVGGFRSFHVLVLTTDTLIKMNCNCKKVVLRGDVLS